MKYVLVVDDGCWFPELIKPYDKVIKAGLYLWRYAFQGEIVNIKNIEISDLQKYDIVHVNLHGTMSVHVPKIKEAIKNSSTKLLMNLDYSVNNIQKGFPYISNLVVAVKQADYLFAQEPAQYSLLKILVKELKKDIPTALIPHPVDTRMKKFKREERMNLISVIFHRYDKQYFIPALLIQGLSGTPTILGYDRDAKIPQINVLYDIVHAYSKWEDFVNLLASSKIAVSYYTIFSQDRVVAESACLEVPVVTTYKSYYGTLLFPELSFYEQNLAEMKEALKKLQEDTTYYEDIVKFAFENVEDYNLENSKRRMVSFLEGEKVEVR